MSRKAMFFLDNGVLDYTVAITFYSLRNVFETWTNAVLKIRRTSDNTTAYVFFDTTTITLSSFISTSSNTTPSATTLSTWVGANDAYVEEWYSQFSNNTIGHLVSQTTTTLQPKFITAGAIITKNGLPTIDFLSDKRYLNGSALSGLNESEAKTIVTVSNNTNNNNVGGVFSTILLTSLNTRRLVIFNDRRSSPIRIGVMATESGTFNANSNVIDNTSNQKLNSLISQGSTKGMRSFYNGESQNVVPYLGAYRNDSFTIGMQFDEDPSFYLQGTIQEIIVFPSNQLKNMRKIHNDVNSYYSIY